MTITADDLEPPDRAGIIRWTVCLLIVLALHGGLLLVAMLRQVPIESIGMPPAAVMIDLAPLPAISAPSAQTPPPDPEQQPLPLPEPELPKFEPSPAPHPPVALPAPQPPKPKPQRIERPPGPQREPVSVPPTSAPGATVPKPPGPTASSSQTVSSAEYPCDLAGPTGRVVGEVQALPPPRARAAPAGCGLSPLYDRPRGQGYFFPDQQEFGLRAAG
jgi:outer membrane biosynthesis protein TonB